MSGMGKEQGGGEQLQLLPYLAVVRRLAFGSVVMAEVRFERRQGSGCSEYGGSFPISDGEGEEFSVSSLR